VAQGAGLLGLMVGLQGVVGRLTRSRELFRATALLLVGTAFATAGLESSLWSLTGQGLALELQLLVILRNMVVVLTALDRHRQMQPLGSAFSLFLVLCAVSVDQGNPPWGWLMLYVLAGSCWLVAWYWQGLSGTLSPQAVRQATLRWSLVIPAALAGFLLLAAVQPFQPRGPLGSLFPTSGGTGASDPTARQGVHDGDLLVAGKHDARSFGPVDSELFLDSDRPSLYDIFNDQYGEPPPRRNADRSVALPPSLELEVEQRMAQSGAAGREFSTVREARRSPGELADQPQPALFHLVGRTPLHLRLEVFDLFDGTTWLAEPTRANRPPFQVETVSGRPWIRIPTIASAGLAVGHDLHLLQIQRLDTNRIPTPWHPLAVHIDRVDQTEFFVWHQETVLGMPRQSLPDSTVIQLQSRPLKPARLAQIDRISSTAHDRYRLLAHDADSQWLRQTARDWTAGLAPGAPQIAAVCQRLKTGGTVVRGETSPVTPPQSIREFLENGRRGPDYLFASSAALLLRGLGYSTRLVSGFYADPARYDVKSRSTPVSPRDVHVWAEVYVGSGTWLELEATPGYELLTTPATLWEQAWQRLVDALAWAGRNAASLSAALALVFGGWWRRRWLWERCSTMVWLGLPSRSPRQRVLETVRLLDLRRRLFGPATSVGATPRQRLHGARVRCSADDPLARFLNCVDWAAYDTQGPCPIPSDQVETLCRQVVHRFTARHWVALSASPSIAPPPRSPSTPHSPLTPASTV
jgi:transglutaminase-like putative cysteine protease